MSSSHIILICYFVWTNRLKIKLRNGTEIWKLCLYWNLEDNLTLLRVVIYQKEIRTTEDPICFEVQQRQIRANDFSFSQGKKLRWAPELFSQNITWFDHVTRKLTQPPEISGTKKLKNAINTDYMGMTHSPIEFILVMQFQMIRIDLLADNKRDFFWY